MNYSKRTFLFFILPSILAFSFVILAPFAKGLYGSFTNWKDFSNNSGDAIVGFENYEKAFKDKAFIKTFLFTLKYAIASIVFINIVGLGLALLLNKAFRGRNIFRSIFFVPNLIGGIMLGYAWQLLFTKGFESLGFNKWLTSNTNTFWALVVVTVWQNAGYIMIIYVAALQNIPQDQIEAAKVSGASKLTIFRRVSVPNLMPAFTVGIFLSIAKAVKIYSLSVSLTSGGINGTGVVSVDIYNTAWSNTEIQIKNHIGLAQAKAMIFTVFVTTLAMIQVIFTKKREMRGQ